MRKVAVFFGGKSCENEISVLTGVFILHLLREKYELFPVYLHTDGGAYTHPKMTDLNEFRFGRVDGFQRVVFDGGTAYAVSPKKGKMKSLGKIDGAINCCHGGLGEGGGVSALCEWNGIPLASPDLTASGVFMDKCLTKLVARALSVPTVDYIRVNEKDYEKRGAFLLKSIEARLKYPVVIKPAHLGSSIGIAVAKNEGEAKAAIESAFALDHRVIIEKFLADKKDVNCAAYSLGNEIVVSEVEAAFGEGIYSFEEKYIKRRSDNAAPMQKSGGGAAVGGELREKIRAYTRTLYKRMNLKGLVRMDFLVSGNQAYLCEVNTVPGSLAYYLFCERMVDARELLFSLIEDAIQRKGEQEKKLVTTGILKTVRWQRK